eukprot:Clim_evm9s31 gene=Clim_evmTU9s31
MVSFTSLATAGLAALAAIAQGASAPDEECTTGLRFKMQEVSCFLADYWYDRLVLGGALPPAGYVRYNALIPEYYQLPAQSKPYASKSIVWNNLDAFNPGWYIKKGSDFELGMYLISNTAAGHNRKALVEKQTFTAPDGSKLPTSDTYTFGDTDDTYCYITVQYTCRDIDTEPTVQYLTAHKTVVHPDADL